MSRLNPNPNPEIIQAKVLKRKAVYLDNEEVEETREKLATMEIDGREGEGDEVAQ